MLLHASFGQLQLGVLVTLLGGVNEGVQGLVSAIPDGLQIDEVVLCYDVVVELLLPPVEEIVQVAAGDGRPPAPVDRDGQRHASARSGAEAHTGVGFLGAAQDEHDCPVAASERLPEGFLVDSGRLRRVAGVRVAPDPQELFDLETGVDAAIGEVGDGGVVEADGHGCGGLQHRDEVLDVEEVVLVRDAETANLGITLVAEELQFQPCQGRENQFSLGPAAAIVVERRHR